jgi:hypothetical protein
MEAIILDALKQDPGVTPEPVLLLIPVVVDTDELYVSFFDMFRHVVLDEQRQLPAGFSVKELALLLDQLIGLAVRRECRGEAIGSGKGSHV